VSGSSRERRDDGRPEQGRPRDRTGRPLPHGTVDVPLIEPVEPATVEEALGLGVQRWNDRRYFEAHELLEFAWKQGPEQDRDLWKGVIQVAVAGVHLQRGNPIGARRLLDRALGRLSGQPAVHRGIDVRALCRTASDARAHLDEGRLPEADWGVFPSCADGVADGVWFAPTADASGPAEPPTAVT
jgi:predicted metal-dependent hydrolase